VIQETAKFMQLETDLYFWWTYTKWLCYVMCYIYYSHQLHSGEICCALSKSNDVQTYTWADMFVLQPPLSSRYHTLIARDIVTLETSSLSLCIYAC